MLNMSMTWPFTLLLVPAGITAVSLSLTIPNASDVKMKKYDKMVWAVKHPPELADVHPDAFYLHSAWKRARFRQDKGLTMRGRGAVKTPHLNQRERVPIIACASDVDPNILYLQFFGHTHGLPDMWLYLRYGNTPALHVSKRSHWKFLNLNSTSPQTFLPGRGSTRSRSPSVSPRRARRLRPPTICTSASPFTCDACSSSWSSGINRS